MGVANDGVAGAWRVLFAIGIETMGTGRAGLIDLSVSIGGHGRSGRMMHDEANIK
jgi:hypothetical protein